MPKSRPPSFDTWLALRHPLWIVSFAVLVANDQWLKGAGVLPGWLTGKLSDVLGLVVAPVLLAVTLRVRNRSRFGAMFLATAVVFTAIKTSTHASALYEHLLSFVSAKNVVDLTDLVALVGIVPAYRVLARAAERPVEARTGQRARVLAVAFAVPFCLATSAPDVPPCAEGTYGSRCARGFRAPIWVGNEGSVDVVVHVRTALLGAAECGEALSCRPEAFGPEEAITLRPLQKVPLATADPCAAALVRLGGTTTRVLLLGGAASELVPYEGPFDSQPSERGGLLVRQDLSVSMRPTDPTSVVPECAASVPPPLGFLEAGAPVDAGAPDAETEGDDDDAGAEEGGSDAGDGGGP